MTKTTLLILMAIMCFSQYGYDRFGNEITTLAKTPTEPNGWISKMNEMQDIVMQRASQWYENLPQHEKDVVKKIDLGGKIWFDDSSISYSRQKITNDVKNNLRSKGYTVDLNRDLHGEEYINNRTSWLTIKAMNIVEVEIVHMSRYESRLSRKITIKVKVDKVIKGDISDEILYILQDEYLHGNKYYKSLYNRGDKLILFLANTIDDEIPTTALLYEEKNFSERLDRTYYSDATLFFTDMNWSFLDEDPNKRQKGNNTSRLKSVTNVVGALRSISNDNN